MSSAVQHPLKSWAFKNMYVCGKKLVGKKKTSLHETITPLSKFQVNKLVLVALFNLSVLTIKAKEHQRKVTLPSYGFYKTSEYN